MFGNSRLTRRISSNGGKINVHRSPLVAFGSVNKWLGMWRWILKSITDRSKVNL